MPTTVTYTPKEIVAYGEEPNSVPVTIKSGVTLVAGTVLGRVTATGLYDAYDNTASTGLEVAAGVLADYVDTSSAGSNEATEAAMYIAGEGLLKTDQLVGMDACALNDLGASEMSSHNLTIFGLSAQNSGDTQVKRTVVNDAAYTVLSTDRLVAVTALSAARTLTLPTAASMKNRVLSFVDESGAATTYNITVDGAGSETINGATTKVITASYGTLKIYSNGTAWFVCP